MVSRKDGNGNDEISDAVTKNEEILSRNQSNAFQIILGR